MIPEDLTLTVEDKIGVGETNPQLNKEETILALATIILLMIWVSLL